MLKYLRPIYNESNGIFNLLSQASCSQATAYRHAAALPVTLAALFRKLLINFFNKFGGTVAATYRGSYADFVSARKSLMTPLIEEEATVEMEQQMKVSKEMNKEAIA
jgi:hypothetical protein